MSLKDIRSGPTGQGGLGEYDVSNVIWIDFRGTRQISVEDYLRSAARNERAAIDHPDLARPFLSLAGQRRRQAAAISKQGVAGV